MRTCKSLCVIILYLTLAFGICWGTLAGLQCTHLCVQARWPWAFPHLFTAGSLTLLAEFGMFASVLSWPFLSYAGYRGQRLLRSVVRSYHEV